MRELRPLLLPERLRINTADCCPSTHQATLDDASEARASACSHSRQSSIQSNEPSPSPSQTFSSTARTHQRMSSSTSSRSASPPRHDLPDLPQKRTAPTPTLPNVQEDPMEREAYEHSHHQTSSIRSAPASAINPYPDTSALKSPARSYHFGSNRSSYVDFPSPADYDSMRDGFCSDSELAFNNRPERRRRSGDSTFNNIASRVITRFPSLTKRSRERKRASTVSSGIHSPTSPYEWDRQSPIAPSPRTGRSRSTSRARSMFRRSGELGEDRDADADFPTAIETIAEDESDSVAGSEVPVDVEPTEEEADGGDDYVRISTPLLPPLMPEGEVPEADISSSTLQSEVSSPTMATSYFPPAPSLKNSPRGTPLHSTVVSPTLSKRTSTNSFSSRQVSGKYIASSDIPPIQISEISQDPWSDKLGHANFTIEPEPYMPAIATRQTCEQLLTDWEHARREYSRHLHRTVEHFGTTSQTYQMTEQKWSSIDKLWRDCYVSLLGHAVRAGEVAANELPSEPAALTKMPSMHDGRNEGKFPQMGDEDIVGPMAKALPVNNSAQTEQAQYLEQKPSRRWQQLKLFLFPSSLLGRI